MAQKDPFVHLHVHTAYSILDGHALIEDLFEEIDRLGQSAIAITDHGNMHGTYQGWKTAQKFGLGFIPGIEAYMTPGGKHHTHKERVFFGTGGGKQDHREEGASDVAGRGTYTHMTLLGVSTEGMHNLFDMSTLSYKEGFFNKPRISVDMLAEYSKDVIATTGCPSGDVQTYLRLGQYENARNYAGMMQEILGKENYFVELMDHQMISNLERGVRGDLLRISKELNIPLLATNDLHYTRKEDAKAQEYMLAMQTKASMSEPPDWKGGKRFAFEGDSYYVKTGKEMAAMFPEEDFPGAITNTQLIAERAKDNIHFEMDISRRPSITIPKTHTPETWIRQEVYQGLEERYGKDGVTDEIKKRAEYELEIIIDKNFVMYFLVVQDFIKWAKDNGVMVGPSRGCLHGNSQILTTKGLKRIAEIQPGDTVFDGNGHKVTVPNKFEYDCDEPLTRITTAYGGEGVSMTADHKVLVSKPNENDHPLSPEWVRADEISTGDFLLTPLLRSEERTNAIMDGSWWAHVQCGSHDGTRLTTLTTKDAVATYELGLDTGHFINGSQIKYKKAFKVPMGLIDVDAQKWNEDVTALLDFPKCFKYGIVDGLWWSNLRNGDKSRAVFTSSKKAYALYILMLSLGIPAEIETFTPTGSQAATYSVHAVDPSYDGSKTETTYSDMDYIYSKVIRVEKAAAEPNGKVYDFSVPTTNSYLTDAGIVHNSGGGSLLTYALGITDIDPIRHNLLFERFLNPERDSAPDLDIDFDDRNRDRVIKYVTEKYGSEYVSNLVTFSQMGGKVALKDAARTLEFPYMVAERISKTYPAMTQGRNFSLKDTYNPEAERYPEAQDLREIIEKEKAQELFQAAVSVDGRIRQTGVHAAGILISSRPINEAMPLMVRQSDGAIISQFDYQTAESLGLLKMDFLGLQNLTIIADALKNIKKLRGETFTMNDIIEGPMDDARTFKLLSKGHTLGVFQLDGGGLQDLLRRISPTTFDDISAAIALYRPGPMGVNAHNDYADRKNGRQPITPIHPDLETALEPILGETYGLCVSGDTLIYDADTGQQVPIRSIEEQVKTGNFKTFSIDNQGQVTPQKVTHWFNTGKKKSYRLRTAYGNELYASEDHPILTPSGYKEIKDILPGEDFVALPGQPFEPLTANSNKESWCSPRVWHKRGQRLRTKGIEKKTSYPIRIEDLRCFLAGFWEEYVKNPVEQVDNIAREENIVMSDILTWSVANRVQQLMIRLGVPCRIDVLERGGSVLSTGGEGFWGNLNAYFNFATQPWSLNAPLDPAASNSIVGKDKGLVYAKREWVRVETVTHVGEETMYDITVDETHNFLANGLVVHNCIYQEQVMEIAQHLAGYSLGEADILRRAMGKKDREVLDSEYAHFASGMMKNGFSEEPTRKLWEVLVPFADYAFNKSHSAGYGLLSYMTAYLKANYPSEYMAALLTSAAKDADKKALYLTEAKKMGLEILLPDVSKAEHDYSPLDDTTITVGLSSIRGVGDASANRIVEERRENGEYNSIGDFMGRSAREVLNKKVLEGLIDGGAFDTFGHTRRGLLLAVPEAARSFAIEKRKQEDLQQDPLFSEVDDPDIQNAGLEITIPDIDEYPKRDKLARERSALGLYVSDHPLSGMQDALRLHSTNQVIEFLSGQVAPVDGFVGRNTKKYKIAGIISSLTLKRTRAGDQFAILTIEDMSGVIEAPLFPSSYENFKSILFTDHVYSFTGVPRQREEENVTFMIDSLQEIHSTDSGKIPVWYKVHGEQLTPESIEMLRNTLQKYPGETPVWLSIKTGNSITTMELGANYFVHPSPRLTTEIQEIFGVGSIGRWRA